MDPDAIRLGVAGSFWSQPNSRPVSNTFAPCRNLDCWKHYKEPELLAGQILAPRQIALVEVDEPELDESTADSLQEPQILFQPELACLCGSDLPFFNGSLDQYPCDVGYSLHEMVGSVQATTGKRFQVGDKVLAVPIDQQGLFERYVVDESRAIALDARVPAEHALLAQPLGTVIYALKKLPNLLDQDVAVVGQGPIGQLFCAALKNLGAREIIAIDLNEHRLANSPAMGATHSICNAVEDAVTAVQRFTNGHMADIVIEAVGHQDQALNLCVDLCRPDGRILYFGVPPTQQIDNVRWHDLFFKNLTVHTSVNPDFRRDFPLAMRWIGEERINVSSLITHRFGLHEIQTAFDTFCDRRDGALKVLVEFPSHRE